MAKTFVVNSRIPAGKTDATTWLLSIPKMLTNAGTDNVRYKTAYCCTPGKKVIAEFKGPDKRTVSKALKGIGMPFTSITEAKKV